MTGRLADLFRLAWGLLYWNTRKSWFRYRRGRSPCPCQSPSDSGRAYETGCDACVHWHNPAAFRRVCPLLVQTKAGLRCSAHTADVRPFWGRLFGYYGGSILGTYLTGAIVVFIFLRLVGYPVNIGHLVWPGSWHRVKEVRGWFFMHRSEQAFAAGHPAEGMLYLSNAYEFDPANYTVASSLAQRLQVGQPLRSDELYRRMMATHPEQRALTAQAWFRALLARGDLATVAELARSELVDDPANASVWMRALVFATRQIRSDIPLRQLLAANAPAVVAPWRPLAQAELLRQAGRKAEARQALRRLPADAPAYSLYYQIAEMIDQGDALAAVDLLQSYGAQIDTTARVTLLLEAYVALDAEQARERLVEALLVPPVNPPTINVLAAHLIRHPSQPLLDRLFDKFEHDRDPATGTSLESLLALDCAAGGAGDWHKVHEVAGLLRANGNALTLGAVESFFRGDTTQTRIAALLPALPLPLECTYALLERYPGPRRALVAPKP